MENSTLVWFVVLALLVFVSAAYVVTSLRRRTPPSSFIPRSMEPPRFEGGAKPSEPVRLTSNTLEHFVTWAAAVPVSEAQLIRDAIASARTDELVLDKLLAQLFQLPVVDFGRHYLMLSILGELRHAKSAERLAEFVNLPGDRLYARTLSEQHAPPHLYFDFAAALQARAAEMLAFVGTPAAFDAVLAAASQHTSRAVRLAALDAFIFNHADSPEAIQLARSRARPEESRLVGLARLERNVDRREFEAKIKAYYVRYPDDKPPSINPNKFGDQREAERPRPRSR
jgi:hypothetical protein